MSDEPSTGLLEQRFLAALGNTTLVVTELLELLNSLHASEPSGKLEQYALVLEDKLAKAGELGGLVSLYEMRLGWVEGDAKATRAITAHLGEALQEAAHKNRLHVAFVKSISLGAAGVPVKESLRRLRLLLQCEPGVLCLDKTWGFGKVVRLDSFYCRMTIDFERKKGHALAFGYAAETLRILSGDHILARFHANKDEFFKRFRDEPAAVVKAALRSFGPMSVTRMEDEFVANGLLPDAESYLPKSVKGKRGPAEVWKRFWTQARADLKSDPEVSLPPSTKKNEPIVLLLKAVSFADPTWFEEYAKLTDVTKILAGASELLTAGKLSQLSEEEAKKAIEILTDRLEFAYVAARVRTHVPSPALVTATDTAVSVNNEYQYRRWRDGVRQGAADMARATLLARELKLAGFEADAYIKEMSNPEFLSQACFEMATRDLASLGALIPVKEDEAVAESFCKAILEMPYAVADVMLPGLLRGVAAVASRERVSDSFAQGTVSFPVLLWMARHQSEEDIRTMVSPSSIAAMCLFALDRQTSGEELRLYHQIAKCFEDGPWVDDLMNRMDADGRQATLDRIRSNDSAWEAPIKRKIVRDILAKFPELSEAHHVEEDASANEAAPLQTSWHSYNAYVENLRRLVEEEIPKNAQDIDVARSYGDLRENFEYQTAKDTQRMLMQRHAELSSQIAAVQGTDFANIPTDKVAMGTEVVLRMADGSEKVYSVLGEWDNEEALGIIPSRSRIAEAVLGKTPGTAVELPPQEAGAAPQNATIEAIRTLSETVRNWIRG